jgi:hypothetical protein
MDLLNRNRLHLFTADTAAHIIYAEIRHYLTEEPIGGPSEAELQTLTRRLSWLVDKDLNWTDIDELVYQIRQITQVQNGTSHMVVMNESRTVDNRDHLLSGLFPYTKYNLDQIVGSIRPRYEAAA